MSRTGRRDASALGLLALVPVLAHAPAWWEGRLLGPGDGSALHYPLRAEVFSAWRHGEFPSWNPAIFSGTPLLSAYRPGALFPTMIALSGLDPFQAFQALVLLSLSAGSVLVFLYLRRLGAGTVGAYVAGLSFSLGPYLVGHLGDTATIVAAPCLLLVLLAAESHMNRGTPPRAAGLGAAVALLLLAGSPEAVRAGGALIAGRLLVGHLFPRADGSGPSLRSSALALALGGLLAAPQLLPTLLQGLHAGRPVTGLAGAKGVTPPGATGLILRYVSHTPAPSLALAALPLFTTETPIRVLGIALALCVALQWGRGPLAAPGALALVFDLTLATLAGLSLSAQWGARRDARGRRLRAHFLLALIASAAALSVSAAALGPLPQDLAGPVGVLALSLILYFSLAASANAVKAGVWLLPLTVSFLLQPHGRRIWEEAPTREELERGTPTREAIDRAMGRRAGERVLTILRRWPEGETLDLAYASLSAVSGRRTANGYDPMVSRRYREAFEMDVGGTLSDRFLRGDPTRVELFGVRWIQVPTSALTSPAGASGLGQALDIPAEAGRPRFFPLPLTAATEVRLASWMSEAVSVRDGEPVADVLVRLASGRDLPLVLRAGRDTAEWAYDRPDVRPKVAHGRAPVLESWSEAGFPGHRYVGSLPLPGRYNVDGVRIERLPGAGRLTIHRLAVVDGASGRAVAVSLPSAYVSDTTRFREAATTPALRLFEVPNTLGHGHVVAVLRVLPSDEAVLRALRAPASVGFDPRREALAVESEAGGQRPPEGGRPSRGEIVRAEGSRIDVRAQGPGLLVVAEGWDAGWRARVDAHAAPVLRVNHIQMGIVLDAGTHLIALRHRAQGLALGAALSAAAGVLALRAAFWRRERRAALI